MATTLLVLAPAWSSGFLLHRDLVAVDRTAWTWRLLGVDTAPPRAVPSDAVAAVLAVPMPDSWVHPLLLTLSLVAAGAGAARLVGRPGIGACAAAVAAIWNPFTAERLLMGHWALLLGYGAVPWLVAELARRPAPRMWKVVLVTVLGCTGGAVAWLLLVAAGLGVVIVRTVGPGRSPLPGALRARLLAVTGAVAVPWAVPALLSPAPASGSAVGFEVFAARADLPIGVLASVLTGGGIWNAGAVPPGRDSPVGAVGALVVAGIGVAGLVAVVRLGRRRRIEVPVLTGLTGVAVAGLAALGLAVVSAVAPGALSWLAEIPGGGLLRDATRQLGLWVVALAAGTGVVVDAMSRRLGAVAAGVVAVVPLAVLPAMAWGVAGALSPVSKPPSFEAVRERVESGPAGAVVVLPFEVYRQYPWNAGTPSLTPWSRMLNPTVVGGSGLVVERGDRRIRVPGEDGYADAVDDALASPAPGPALDGLGVRWLVADSGDPWVPTGYAVSLRTPEVTLYERTTATTQTSSPTRPPSVFSPPLAPVLLADLVALLVLAGAGSGWAPSGAPGRWAPPGR